METAKIGDDTVRIFPAGEKHLAELVIEGVPYVLDDTGLRVAPA